jgi:DNA-binding transcriptional LysR family regulator
MDLLTVDLNLLKAFDALMAERHVTRAAQRIGISQPAMSAALARLRRLTGDELLVRSPSGLAPTPRATDLADPVRQALAIVVDALGLKQVFDPATVRQTFRVALADLPAQLLAAPLVREVMRIAPNADVRLRTFRDRRDAIGLLDDGCVDVAIGVSPGHEPRILHQALFEQRFVGIAAADSGSAGGFADLDAFCAARHLLVSPEGDDFGAVDAALGKLGRTRRIVASVAAMHLAPEIVAGSDLIAALPEGMVAVSPFRDRLDVFLVPVAIDPVAFHLLWHRRNDDHAAQRWLRDAIAAAVPVAGSESDRHATAA